MKHFIVKHSDRKYKVHAKDSVEAVEKVKELEDERLSPMTYSKLKELGYDHNDWKNLTQEQANKIIAKGKKETQPKETNKEQKSKTKQTGKSKVETTSWKDIEEGDVTPINGKYYYILQKGSNSVKVKEYPDGYSSEIIYKDDIQK